MTSHERLGYLRSPATPLLFQQLVQVNNIQRKHQSITDTFWRESTGDCTGLLPNHHNRLHHWNFSIQVERYTCWILVHIPGRSTYLCWSALDIQSWPIEVPVLLYGQRTTAHVRREGLETQRLSWLSSYLEKRYVTTHYVGECTVQLLSERCSIVVKGDIYAPADYLFFMWNKLKSWEWLYLDQQKI